MPALWYVNETIPVEQDTCSGRLHSVSLDRIGPAVGSAHPSGEALGGTNGGGLREPSAAPVEVACTSAFEKKAVLQDLTDYNTVTEAHLDRLVELLPPAAFYAARDEVDRCHPAHPSRYAVTVLNQWLKKGRYV